MLYKHRLVMQVDDMGARIDDLEKTIADLMEEAEATLPAQEGNPGKGWPGLVFRCYTSVGIGRDHSNTPTWLPSAFLEGTMPCMQDAATHVKLCSCLALKRVGLPPH
eukprot:835614-Pelagomonas_calceolata.AAC.1